MEAFEIRMERQFRLLAELVMADIDTTYQGAMFSGRESGILRHLGFWQDASEACRMLHRDAFGMAVEKHKDTWFIVDVSDPEDLTTDGTFPDFISLLMHLADNTDLGIKV